MSPSISNTFLSSSLYVFANNMLTKVLPSAGIELVIVTTFIFLSISRNLIDVRIFLKAS